VALDEMDAGKEEIDDGDDDNIEMFDTDGTRDRVNVGRIGTFKGRLGTGGSIGDVDLGVRVILDVTRGSVGRFRIELGPAPFEYPLPGDFVGTKGEEGAPRDASDTVDLEWCMVRLARLCLEFGEDGLDRLT
jgi:hypothetical protein